MQVLELTSLVVLLEILAGSDRVECSIVSTKA